MIEQVQTIVVGVVNDSQVVCVPAERFVGLATMHTVEKEGGTWGDLRRKAPSFVQEEIEPRFWNPDSIPGDNEPLDAMRVPGAEEGDWPWPAADMIDWLAKDIQQEFGTEISTTLNGEYLQIDPERLDDLVAALQSRGYNCRRDDTTMNVISGY